MVYLRNAAMNRIRHSFYMSYFECLLGQEDRIGNGRLSLMTTKSTQHIASSLAQACPRYEHAVQVICKRWTGLLLNVLMDGPRRFCELTTLVEGLSDRVLSGPSA